MAETRSVFKSGVSAVIYTNTAKLIKGDTIRDKFLVMADSVVFLSDANAAGGYMAISSVSSNVDISFIKSTSPTGKFLKDDGTWADAGLPSQTGSGGKFLTTNGSVASWAALTDNTINGTFLFSPGQGIDSISTVDVDVLSIGVTNANIINYGNSTTVHNFFGTAIYEKQINSYVTDKLITLNSGGAVSSGVGVGFEVEENAVITGYYKTNAARNGFSLKPPAIGFKADLNNDLLSADRAYSFPNFGGTLLVGAVADTLIAYSAAGVLTGSTDFAYSATGKRLTLNGTAFFGGTTTPTAYVDITAATSGNASLRLRAGSNPGTPNNGDVWYTSANGHRFWGEGRSVSIGPLVAGTSNALYFAQTPSSSNPALSGTDSITTVNASGAVNIQIGGSARMSFNDLITASAPFTFATGTSSAAPIILVSGTLKTTASQGSLEYVTSRLYFTRNGNVRETIAYLSDITSATPGGGTSAIQYNDSGGFNGSGKFIFTADFNYLRLDGSGGFGNPVSVDPTAFVDIAPANGGRASLRIRSTDGASGPTAPNEGDIWNDGTRLWIRMGGANKRFTIG